MRLFKQKRGTKTRRLCAIISSSAHRLQPQTQQKQQQQQQQIWRRLHRLTIRRRPSPPTLSRSLPIEHREKEREPEQVSAFISVLCRVCDIDGSLRSLPLDVESRWSSLNSLSLCLSVCRFSFSGSIFSFKTDIAVYFLSDVSHCVCVCVCVASVWQVCQVCRLAAI